MVCTAQGFHSASPEEKGCESLEYNSKFFTYLEPEKYLASKIKEKNPKNITKRYSSINLCIFISLYNLYSIS